MEQARHKLATVRKRVRFLKDRRKTLVCGQASAAIVGSREGAHNGAPTLLRAQGLLSYNPPMLMVIFGAGASYDSCPTYPPGTQTLSLADGDVHANKFYRPPLANELFENRPFFADTIRRFAECRPIVPRLRSLRDETLEAALEDLKTKSEDYPRGRRQLAAVQFYLQQIIRRCGEKWEDVAKGVSNYEVLLDCIERTFPKESVCLATFNYDTLLESALQRFGLPIASLEDYTKRHSFYRVFKLHGSINWARKIETTAQIKSAQDSVGDFNLMMTHWDEIRLTDEYKFSSDYIFGPSHEPPLFPAIALPVETKRDFECPLWMIEELANLLPKVTKILIVGWRATEKHFVKMLGNKLTGLRPKVRIHIVAGSRSDAEEIRVRLHGAMLNNRPETSLDPSGFTEFLLSGRAAEFFSI